MERSRMAWVTDHDPHRLNSLVWFGCLLSFTASISSCGRFQSDEALYDRAVKQADTVRVRSDLPEGKLDSLVVEQLISVFCSARRPEALIKAMEQLPHSDANPAAHFGQALGYAMLKDENASMHHLGIAIEGGDYHLDILPEAVNFQVLVGVPEFQILLETAKTNHYKHVAQVKFEAKEPVIPDEKPPLYPEEGLRHLADEL